jgi:4-hydroxybenzoate polyprenyltransferase
VRVLPYLKLLRPTQWLKNLMLLFPPFLGGVILREGMIGKAVVPFASFCLASSATYILNDILDAEHDSHHQTKRNRPIPANLVKKSVAACYGICLLALAVALGTMVSRAFLVFLFVYLAVTVAYSIKLKEFPIVDLFCISVGFLLRLHAGGEVYGIAISEWLFLNVFLLAIFLSTGKRLGEKISLGDSAGAHRKSLLVYPEGFLDGTLYLTGAAVLVTYTLYVISRHSLVYTVPLCTFGLLRYILRVKSGRGGDPTHSLVKDGPLFVTGLFWALMMGWSIYGR